MRKDFILGLVMGVIGFAAALVWPLIPYEPYFALVFVLYAVAYSMLLIVGQGVFIRWVASVFSFFLFAMYLGFSVVSFIGFIVSAFFLLWAVWECEDQKKSSVKFLLRNILGKSLHIYFTALALLIAFFYYGSVQKSSEPIDFLIPEKVFGVTLKLLEKPLQIVLPGFTAEGSVDDVLIALVTGELRKNPSVDISKISSVELKRLVAKQREEYAKTIAGDVGALRGDEKVSSALYRITLKKIKDVMSPYIVYVPLIVAASYFLALKAVSILFFYATLAVTYVALWFLLLTGIVKKELVPAEREVIV